MNCLCGANMNVMYTGDIWRIWRCENGTHIAMKARQSGQILWYHLEERP